MKEAIGAGEISVNEFTSLPLASPSRFLPTIPPGENEGYRVVRFWNSEIREDLGAVRLARQMRKWR